MYQTTISKKLTFSGIGLHSGKTVTCTLRPACEDTGIVFHVYTAGKIVDIIPTPDTVTATGLATTLSKGDVSVSTVEHLLATLRGLAIDNVHIDVNGKEIPILDGSAKEFTSTILAAGLTTQRKARHVLKALSSFTVCDGDKHITVEPFDKLHITYTIKFPHPSIGAQKDTLSITPASFATIAKARTFGFLKDVEALRAHGLALGGSLDNAIVLDESGIMNKDGLRHKNEFVYHKILDFIGDMAVLPFPLLGKFTICCSGHGLNNIFARKALAEGIFAKKTIQPIHVPPRRSQVYMPYATAASPLLAG